MVDNNITMLGYPGSYHQEFINYSEDQALKKLAETYYIPETLEEYYHDVENLILGKGTHALIYSFLDPNERKLGKWWRSTEYIPGFTPYGAWLTRINWYLNEV